MNDCKRRKENVSFSNARVAKLGLLISLKRRWVDLHSPSFTALPSVDQVLIPRLVYRHTTLQIVSTSHNQLWDRIYFFGQFGFGRVLKSTKNPNNDPYDSRTSKGAKRREIQLKFEKVSQYFPSKPLETIPNPLYRVDLVIYGWIR